MAFRIGNLSLSRFIKGMLGIRLIDPIEVYYLKGENLFYPIISKSGCSSVKQDLIRLYNPEFSSKFPEIHQIDPSKETEGNVLRKHFYSFKKYRKFSEGKKTCLVIRNPYERIFSCYLDVQREKNIMYQDPSGLTKFFGVNSSMTFDQFLAKVIKTPDYLSDRHFRSQYFYLDKGVENALADIQIILLENYSDKGKSTTRLNTNNKSLPEDILTKLQSSKAYNKRFEKDIEMYNTAKAKS